MKDKDLLCKRTSSSDNKQRFIVIEFTGWYVGSISNPILWEQDPTLAPPRKSLTLTYKMLGHPDLHRLPFPHNKPDKRRVQWQTLNLSQLKQGHYYAAWIINGGTPEQGDWYWTRIVELTKPQAEQIKKAKFDRPYRDKWMNPLEVELTAIHGHPHGHRIFDDIKRKNGTTNVPLHEIMRVSKSYWDEQNKIPVALKHAFDRYFQSINAQDLLKFE